MSRTQVPGTYPEPSSCAGLADQMIAPRPNTGRQPSGRRREAARRRRDPAAASALGRALDSLLGNRQLIGRRDELNLLTDWVAHPSSEAYRARLLALAAIGGVGKSALAWT